MILFNFIHSDVALPDVIDKNDFDSTQGKYCFHIRDRIVPYSFHDMRLTKWVRVLLNESQINNNAWRSKFDRTKSNLFASLPATVIFPAKTKVTEASTLKTVSIRLLLIYLCDQIVFTRSTEEALHATWIWALNPISTVNVERIACDSHVIFYYYYAYNLQLASHRSFVFWRQRK